MNIEQRGINAVFFLDIKNAFDTVNHEVLLTKLQCCGIRGQELEFFTSRLSERIQCCSVNGKTAGYREREIDHLWCSTGLYIGAIGIHSLYE